MDPARARDQALVTGPVEKAKKSPQTLRHLAELGWIKRSLVTSHLQTEAVVVVEVRVAKVMTGVLRRVNRVGMQTEQCGILE